MDRWTDLLGSSSDEPIHDGHAPKPEDLEDQGLAGGALAVGM